MLPDTTLCAVYFLGVFIASAIRGVYTRGSRPKALRQPLTPADAAIFGIGGAAFLLPVLREFTPALDFADYGLPGSAGILGIFLYGPALWLMWRGYADLGENWFPTVRIREGHVLVTSGVYSRVRHPLYAAHALWGIVQLLLIQNWIAGPPMLLTMLVVLVWRVPAEEARMLEHFGEEYRAYMNRTGRVLPRLASQRRDGQA